GVDDSAGDPDRDGRANVDEFLGQTDPLFGDFVEDVDVNGLRDATDLQLVINAVLGWDIAPYSADVNHDGLVNAADVQTVVNGLLSAR
ncbi:MAG: Dockerin type domain, partial [Candidatus Hydrogenedentes bacterium]|nr:Dockerin type domain [Candidatus Hydrogenedentota bacterium]